MQTINGDSLEVGVAKIQQLMINAGITIFTLKNINNKKYFRHRATSIISKISVHKNKLFNTETLRNIDNIHCLKIKSATCYCDY